MYDLGKICNHVYVCVRLIDVKYNKLFLRTAAKLRDSIRESKFASDFH
jgi:hypothetical protein